jgi:hypothetical protein
MPRSKVVASIDRHLLAELDVDHERAIAEEGISRELAQGSECREP